MVSRDIRVENGEGLNEALAVLYDFTRLLKAFCFWTGRRYASCMV
jgi:hypothetical protein